MTFPPSAEEFLREETFSCVKCGECCRPIVKVSEEDILRLEKTGKKRKDFLAEDPFQPHQHDTLKQHNGKCLFLQKQGDVFVCSMYEHRPDTCRQYPFFRKGIKDCRPPGWERWTPIALL